MAEPDRNLVLDPSSPVVEGSIIRQRRRTGNSHRKLHHQLQRGCSPVCMDQECRPPKTPQAMFRGLAILGTSDHLRSQVVYPSCTSSLGIPEGWSGAGEGNRTLVCSLGSCRS